ncbi:hypothetical protein HCA69_05785 [Listeria grandensis]|uniref:B-band O-antigen polymerase n=1 Tax=Listeria grandensis TaxID=1494963 RepID=A0A7X0Y2M5_9LIST|nr:hypothetical protein [Listeria grandensis]MBC1935870.1 hypothetical protein [Listeria grandensis]
MHFRIGRVVVVLGVVLYILSLYIAYIQMISPAYSYYQLINLHPSLLICTLSSLVAILPSFWSSYQVNRPSQVIYWVLYLFAYIPVMIIPDFIRENPMDSFWMFKITVFISLIALYGATKLPLILIKNLKVPQQIANMGLLVFTITLYSIIIGTFGFHINPVAFSEVYSLRESFRLETNKVAGYALVWLSKIMDIFFVAVGWLQGNLLLIFLGVIGQLYVYSITGHKSVAVSLGLLIIILYCLKKNGSTFGIKFIWLILGLVLGTMLLDWLNKDITFTEIFTRRMLLLPGALSSLFFDFFSTHEKTYLGHSILRNFLDYPYEGNPSNVIGLEYFGSLATSANANMWADGFSAFGYGGVLIFSLLLALILWIYDSISKQRNLMVSVGLMVMPAWSLVDSSFIIALFTNGIFIAIAINYCYRSDLWKGASHEFSKNSNYPI